jgi:2-polyprenyl-3-methyl-5-hydroxy-6-metoxy-1,4-benzoquinol methylase
MEQVRRTTCSACGDSDLPIILDLGMSPIADAYTAQPEDLSNPQLRYPLELASCRGCHLVQLMEVLPQDILFGTGYSFYSSASAPLSQYHAKYAQRIMEQYKSLAQRLVVEIGCNDGDMLRHFNDMNCSTVGVDPSGGPVKVAYERNLNVINESFTVDVAQQIIDEHGQAGVVIANHVLAHVENVSDVLHGIANLLSPDGVAFIEVQYLPDLIVNNAFDLVYHEHRNFFSLTTLASAARQWNLYIRTAELTDRQGGSLRAVLSRGARRPDTSVERLLVSERWLTTRRAYGGLQGRAERMRDRLCDLTRSVQRDKLIAYGAPAKATTLFNFCGIDEHDIAYVVDTTVAKQNRFMPGTCIPIIAPSGTYMPANDGVVLLAAWNYARTIMQNHAEWTMNGGRWILPVPAPMML